MTETTETKGVERLVGKLKPYRDLIAIVLALGGAAYGALTYFATADQLDQTRQTLETMQTERHAEAIAALETTQNRLEGRISASHDTALAALDELKCLTRLNRQFLRAEIEEFRLVTLLEKNLSKSTAFSTLPENVARAELANLEVNREAITAQLGEVTAAKRDTILALQDGTCSGS